MKSQRLCHRLNYSISPLVSSLKSFLTPLSPIKPNIPSSLIDVSVSLFLIFFSPWQSYHPWLCSAHYCLTPECYLRFQASCPGCSVSYFELILHNPTTMLILKLFFHFVSLFKCCNGYPSSQAKGQSPPLGRTTVLGGIKSVFSPYLPGNHPKAAPQNEDKTPFLVKWRVNIPEFQKLVESLPRINGKWTGVHVAGRGEKNQRLRIKKSWEGIILKVKRCFQRCKT